MYGALRQVIWLLTVKTPEEAAEIVRSRFGAIQCPAESVDMIAALGRVLAGDIVAGEYVPGFDRSTVDGYAVIASDTFGCSESMPAVLTLSGEILMGEAASGRITPGTCLAVSTGGDLPEGADAVVMVEHTEDYGAADAANSEYGIRNSELTRETEKSEYGIRNSEFGDGTSAKWKVESGKLRDRLIGILSPVAPGNSMIFRGDDVSPGDRVLKAGTLLTPHDIGILSALGYFIVDVRPKPVVGVISTGDELVEPTVTPGRGQIRDVNTPMLMAAAERFGAVSRSYGIVRDEESALRGAVLRAVAECDIILVSGGSSAGMRDLTARVIESAGELLLHGIAMKPGKPTILGVIEGKPVFGLPGHPVAAYFVMELFVRPLIAGFMGASVRRQTATARISEAVSSNHGRAEYIAVFFDEASGTAQPIRGKSGLIASLAGADGYICIPRDSEGIPAGATVNITYF